MSDARNKLSEVIKSKDKVRVFFFFIESLVELVKIEQGHFDAESVLFLDLQSRSMINE